MLGLYWKTTIFALKFSIMAIVMAIYPCRAEWLRPRCGWDGQKGTSYNYKGVYFNVLFLLGRNMNILL